jgi:hypothetical protein
MRLQRVGLVAIAVTTGCAIAVVDASPGWDSTGITAGSLLLAAGVVTAIAGDRPWLWAILIGTPTPLLEISTGGSSGAFLAVGFAAIGAAIGWTVARAAGGSAERSTRE